VLTKHAAPPPPLLPQAQFFADLKEFCVDTADKDHKTVLVAGLDGDFRRESFGQVRLQHVCGAPCAPAGMCGLLCAARVTAAVPWLRRSWRWCRTQTW
jgi:hypothetical protein